MFLFEGNFGNTLHTVDCILTAECVQSLPKKYVVKKGTHGLHSIHVSFIMYEVISGLKHAVMCIL